MLGGGKLNDWRKPVRQRFPANIPPRKSQHRRPRLKQQLDRNRARSTSLTDSLHGRFLLALISSTIALSCIVPLPAQRRDGTCRNRPFSLLFVHKRHIAEEHPNRPIGRRPSFASHSFNSQTHPRPAFPSSSIASLSRSVWSCDF